MQQNRESEADLVRLLATVQDLSRVRTLEELMGVVRVAAHELTAADGVTFVLRDADKCYYAEENAISPLWKGQRFPMSACISGWAMLGRREAVVLDVNAQIRAGEKLLRRPIGEDVELVTRLTPDLYPVKFDSSQVDQIIMNLAVNARDAMPDGGRLTIQTENVDLAACGENRNPGGDCFAPLRFGATPLAMTGSRVSLRGGRVARRSNLDFYHGLLDEEYAWDHWDARLGILEKGVAFIEKPIIPDVLCERVRIYLEA